MKQKIIKKSIIFIIAIALLIFINSTVYALELQKEVLFKEISFSDLIQGNDNGYITVGYNFDDTKDFPVNGSSSAFIIKFNDKLEIEWKKFFDGNGGDYFYSVTNCEKGYVSAGLSSSSDIESLTNPNKEEHPLIVKYDNSGNLIWKKLYTYNKGSFYDVIHTSNDEYIAVGYIENEKMESQGLIVKYDKNGNEIWKQTYATSSTTLFKAASLTNDNGLVIVGKTKENNFDALIIKCDSNGHIEWQKNFGGSKSEEFSSIAVTKDNEFVAVGYTESNDINGITNNGESDSIIIKFDNSGNIIWQKNFGYQGEDEFFSIISSANEYIVCGVATTATDNMGAIMLNYDSNGNIIWKEEYDKTNSNEVFGSPVINTKTNTITLIGFTGTDASSSTFILQYSLPQKDTDDDSSNNNNTINNTADNTLTSNVITNNQNNIDKTISNKILPFAGKNFKILLSIILIIALIGFFSYLKYSYLFK